MRSTEFANNGYIFDYILDIWELPDISKTFNGSQALDFPFVPFPLKMEAQMGRSMYVSSYISLPDSYDHNVVLIQVCIIYL